MSEQSDERGAQSAGQRLKQARIDKGLELALVSKRLHLRQAILEQFENDDFHSHGNVTYTKGYLKAYAKLLDLDPSDLLAQFEAQNPQSADQAPMQSFSNKTVLKESDSRLMKVTWLLVLALIGMLLWWGWQQVSVETPLVPEPLPEESQQETDPMALESDDTTFSIPVQRLEPQREPPQQAQPDPAGEQALPLPSSQPPGNTAPAAGQAPDTPTGQAEQGQPQAQNNGLSLSFSGDCWVKIVDATGRVLTQGVKTPGEQLFVQGQAPYGLTLGAPENVSLSHAGQGVDLSAFRPGKVARLTVPNQE